MLQLGIVDECCKATHVRLAMMQSTFCAYNASSQLISSVKGMFVESLNVEKVMRVGIVNPFRLNGMETQGFPSAKLPAPFCGTEPAA